MEGNSTSRTITLKSKDGVEFLVPEMVAMHSRTIRHMIEDDCAQKTIPVYNVNAHILAKVIQYCEQHINAEHVSETETTNEGSSTKSGSSKFTKEELENWDRRFLDVDQETIFQLILAANYLDITKLLDATCQKVADMISGKSPEEIRQILNIVNDFSMEEEQESIRENRWASQ